jgi:hypothetical protein
MSLWRCEHAAQIDAMASNCKFGFGSERELLRAKIERFDQLLYKAPDVEPEDYDRL